MRPKLAPRHPMRNRDTALYEPQTEKPETKTQSDPLASDFYRDETDYGRYGDIVLWHVPTEADVHPDPVTYGRAPLPNRNIGGRVGSYNRLGWTKGIAPFRSLRQPFEGQMLTLHGSKAHPANGPVGKRNWLGHLAESVRYNYVDLDPTPQQVAGWFTYAPVAEIEDWERG